MTLLYLALSLAVVTLGAELLVRGASTLALRAGLSPLFVGLTIVGIGTSTPELGASLAATGAGSSGVVVGNVIGSNILNIGLILGLTALVRPIRLTLGSVRRDLVIALLVACAPLLALAFGGRLPRPLGALFVLALATYIATTYRAGRRATDGAAAAAAGPHGAGAVWINLGLIALGVTALALGSRWFVGNAIALADQAGVSDEVIGLTIVSAGTSLPELVTSLVAAARRNPEIAVGNVIGSNIFNILGVLGVCALVQPQWVPPSMLAVHTPVMVLATVAAYLALRTGGTVSRREGGALVVGYALYLAALLLVPI